jgi:hypothetical protein
MARPGKEQRSLSNFVKKAGLQKGYYLHIMAGGVAFLAILVIYASRLIGELNQVVSSIPDPVLMASLQDRIFLVSTIFFTSFMAFVISTVFYMIVIGQRVGGPIVAICAYIEELKKGNYSAKRTLRKNDELVPILNDLQELAEILKKQAP